MGQCYIWKSWSNASSEKNVFEHNILSIDSCRFCVSLIRIYSYRWYPFFLVILSQISCFFLFFLQSVKMIKIWDTKKFLAFRFHDSITIQDPSIGGIFLSPQKLWIHIYLSKCFIWRKTICLFFVHYLLNHSAYIFLN